MTSPRPLRSVARTPLNRQRAFSLVELMVIVAVIGTVLGTVVVGSGMEWRRQRVNAVAQELAGWLGQVRSASQRRTGEGCLVAFSATGIYNAGDVIAQIKPGTACIDQLPETEVRIPNSFGGTSYSISVSPNSAELQFTPRGTATNTNQLVVGIRVANTTPQRCVRISPLVALIRIGRNDTSTSDACTSYSDFSPF